MKAILTPHRLCVLLFSLACIALSLPWVSGRYTIPWDAKAQFLPQVEFLAHALHSGQSPFWTPNIYAGWPQIADPQSQIFSPPFLLLALLNPSPSFQAVDATLFLMLFMGGLGVIAFFQDHGWHPTGALVAAISFAFGGSAAWRIQHVGEVVSLCWLMLAFWLLSRALYRSSGWWGLWAGLVAGFMVLGRDQIAWLGVLTLTGYVLWYLLAGDLKGLWSRCLVSLKPLTTGLLAGLAVTAIPLALTLALAASSNRPEIDFAGAAKGSLHPASLFTLGIPNLFGVDGPLSGFWGPPSPDWGPTDLYLARNMGTLYLGILPVLALVYAILARGLLMRRGIRFFLVAALAILVYALGRYTPVFALLFDVPGASLFRRPADATFLVCAFVSVAGGFGVHCLLSEPQKPRDGLKAWIAGGLVLAVLAGGLGTAVLKHHAVSATPALVLALLMAAASLAALFAAVQSGAAMPRKIMLLLATLLVLDLQLGNGPNESTALPPSDYDVLRPGSNNTTLASLKRYLAASAAPDRRDRVEVAGVGFAWPNISLVHDLDHDLGYNPLRLKLFVDATGAGDHVALPEQRVFSPLFSSYHSPLLDLMGVRFLALGVQAETMDPHWQAGSLTLLEKTPDAYIYENPRALPRVMLATQAQRADFAAMILNGQWPDVDFTRTVLLENVPQDAHLPGRETGTARILAYHNTDIQIEVTVPKGGGWLVLNDTWHPWWQVEVDGVTAPILRANVMFRAVAVPEGRHGVHFSFRPLIGLASQFMSGGLLAH